MENRFGIKDLVMVSLLVVIIVIAGIGWRAAGRQAQEIQDIAIDVEKMQGEVQRLREKIEQVSKELDQGSEQASREVAATAQAEPDVE